MIFENGMGRVILMQNVETCKDVPSANGELTKGKACQVNISDNEVLAHYIDNLVIDVLAKMRMSQVS